MRKMTESHAEAARIAYNDHIFEHACTTVRCAEARRLFHAWLEAAGVAGRR
jgi:hypothetical protein